MGRRLERSAPSKRSSAASAPLASRREETCIAARRDRNAGKGPREGAHPSERSVPEARRGPGSATEYTLTTPSNCPNNRDHVRLAGAGYGGGPGRRIAPSQPNGPASPGAVTLPAHHARLRSQPSSPGRELHGGLVRGGRRHRRRAAVVDVHRPHRPYLLVVTGGTAGARASFRAGRRRRRSR